MDKYEKLYNEALEQAKKELATCGSMDCDAARQIFRFFPQLKESEDERIRKHLVAIVEMYWGKTNDPDKAKELAYLEKQKEFVSEDFESIWEIEDCKTLLDEGEKLSPRFKEMFKEVCHSWYDKGIEVGIKQKETHYTKRNALFDKCVAECDPAVMKEVSDEIDEMLEKEQKPNSTEDMYIADEHFYERTPADSFKYKLAEYMTKNYRKAEGPYGHTYLISAETILKMAEEELLKRGVVQKPVMIQWTGKNLKEVIDFTGKSPKFGEWFKSWEDFENYVHSHDDILKLFCEDGSHYEVPAGAWIVKTPDGYNTPSRFRFIQKPAEWSEEDEDMLNSCISSIEEAKENRYAYKETDGDTSYDHEIDWLKSLRPQPKVELSEDVKKTLDEVSHILIGLNYKQIAKDYKQAIEKLLYSHPSWKPSEDEERLINTSISFLKDFADKGYENAVECIDWLKSKLNGNSGK